VIWLDHYLLGIKSGLDFVAMLKKNRLGKNLPLFVVSNTISQDKLQSYLSLGVVNVYAKVDHRLDEIITDIKKYIESNKI
jgi:CheY-like chemotaxis protein